MANKKFKAESKQLLDLMINSIYSNKDVFLRELISNASDALDKRHFNSLSNNDKFKELFIELEVDKENNTITILDNGIGMDSKDLDNNLGTIARSGSKEFMEKIKDNKDKIDVIGQFGVGFYSSFIIAKKVEVFTKKVNEPGYKWLSNGIDSYSIEEFEKEEIGTKIVLHLKESELEFLEDFKLEELIKNYSDYVKYPIYMNIEEKKEEETVVEKKILNSQKAIWKKDKKEIKEEEYNEFYKSKFQDFNNPLKVIHSKVEGTLNYEMLLFLPENKPFDWNSSNFKKGLDLYSKGILIDKDVDYLLPDAFSFVKGLIDSEDINLNISREMLQKDDIVNKLTIGVEKKIKKELLTLQKKDRVKYNILFENFGRMITYGIYDNYGQKKELLKDLVMFKSNKTLEYMTFAEYIENNKEQEEIYYVSGSSIEEINQLPVMETVVEKDIEVLYFLNDVDEFAIQILSEYDSKKFVAITKADLSSDTERKEIQKIEDENKDILKSMCEALNGLVGDVKLTNKLKDSSVYLNSGDGMSLEMEKILSQMPEGTDMKSTKILEINPEHEIFSVLKNADSEKLIDYSKLLYNQAVIASGLKVENMKEYNSLIDNLIIESNK